MPALRSSQEKQKLKNMEEKIFVGWERTPHVKIQNHRSIPFIMSGLEIWFRKTNKGNVNAHLRK